MKIDRNSGLPPQYFERSAGPGKLMDAFCGVKTDALGTQDDCKTAGFSAFQNF